MAQKANWMSRGWKGVLAPGACLVLNGMIELGRKGAIKPAE